MSDVKAYTCPGCGAPVDPHRRVCDYCGSRYAISPPDVEDDGLEVCFADNRVVARALAEEYEQYCKRIRSCLP